MEKFAVDLEKVLDEFEFNEEREEQVAHTSVKAQSLSHIGICQVPLGCTPAASYRRPSFEPINLAEADFAASPPSTSLTHYNNDLVNTHNFSRENLLIINNTLSNRSYINPSSSKNLQNVNNFVSIEEVATETEQEVFQPEKNWSVNNGVNPSVGEEKPDLLDYSSLSPSNVSVQTNHLPTQLPDITTSVWTLPDIQNRLTDTKGEHITNAPLLDLINSSCGSLLHQISAQENVKENYPHLLSRDAESVLESQHSVNVQNKSLQENTTDLLPTDNVKSDDGSYHIDYNSTRFEKEDNNMSANISVKDCVSVTDTPTYHVETTFKQDENDCNFEHSTSEHIQVDSSNRETKTKNIIESSDVFSDTSHSCIDTGVQLKPCEGNSHNKNISVESTPKEEPLKTQYNIDKSLEEEDCECTVANDFSKNVKEEGESKESKPSDHMLHKSTCLESEVAAVSDHKINNDVKPVSFICDNDVSEGELEQFLQELIEEENNKTVHNRESSCESLKQDVNLNNTTESTLHNSVLDGKSSEKSIENLTSVEENSVESSDSSVNVSKSIPDNDCLDNNSTYQEPEFQNTLGILTTDNYNMVISETFKTEKETNIQLNAETILEESSSLTSGIDKKENVTIKTDSSKDQSIQTADMDSQTTTDITSLPKYDDIVQESSGKCIIQLSNNKNKVINKSQSDMKVEEDSYCKVTELRNTFSETREPSENNTNSVTTLETSTELENSEVVHEDRKQLDISSGKVHETATDKFHCENVANELNSEVHNRCKGESEYCVLSEKELGTSELCNNLDKVQNEDKKVCTSGACTENINVTHSEQVINLENKENCNETLSSKCSIENSPSFDTHSSGPSAEEMSVANNKVADAMLDVNAKMIPIKNGVEVVSQAAVDEAGTPAEEEKPPRPSFLELANAITMNDEATNTTSPSTSGEVELSPEEQRLGKIPPFWVPDSEAPCCMQCQVRFHLLKRRHHCRSCGQVLCSKCCGLKARIEYLDFTEARVCQPCFTILDSSNSGEAHNSLGRQPNPNNPMEYCSTIPPLQQAAGSLRQPPPTVMVPVGVLKREGRSKSDVAKQVMFSDGIRPGGDLTELDGSGETRMPFRRQGRLTKRVGTPPGGPVSFSAKRALDPMTHSFIPAEGTTSLPPTITRSQGELLYSDLEQPITLNQPPLKFAVNRNLYVLVKRVFLDCCVNQECWCISSEGLACVGQDEIVLLLECLPQENFPPKDAFLLINTLYQDASKGTTVTEMSFTPAMSSNLLGSRDHGGFLYIRPTYQCTSQLILPQPPYLVALLIDRWETPWARLFPLRLVLRLGAEYRYYPCPLVSVRGRQPLYTDIGHTIINVLADFRKFSYTLPTVRGLMIHMEDRQTTILLPRNRYDQVVRALNNSNESVLAFGANLSLAADSHLVCMQTSEDENTSYHTQAINIHNKPRRVTGASFVVFNGALKTPGLAGKSSIVEDGLMVQVPSDTMKALHAALRDMRDFSIGCGPKAEETVLLQWTADDTNFNIGVKSCIDGRPLDGIPCIRVHNGTDYSGGTKLIRWTEVFILQCEEGADHTGEPLDISRLSESLARATCLALVPHLELLSAASLTTLAVRATIHPENVGYEAGSNGEKLPPLYMKSLDDELVAVVDEAALAAQDTPATLELIFRVMEQG